MTMEKVFEHLSDDTYHFEERASLIGQPDSPVFLEQAFHPGHTLNQGRCIRDKESGQWDVQLAEGWGYKSIGLRPNKLEAVSLLWERREEGWTSDIGI